jgi:hypothetical protein
VAEKTIQQKLDEAKQTAEDSGLLPYLKEDKDIEEMLFGGKKKKKKKKKKGDMPMMKTKSDGKMK